MVAHPLAPDWLDATVDANALLPGLWAENVVRTGAEISISGIPASQLAAEFGTPLYVVDEAHVRDRAQAMLEVFHAELARIGTTGTMYYAGKAFLCTEVARWVTAAGLGVDVSTGGELAVALAAGVNPVHLGFHGNNKSLAEIEQAIAAGVGTIILDSALEIERVALVARAQGARQRVRLRVNSGVHAHTHSYLATAHEDQKFGVSLVDAPGYVASIREHHSLEFVGLHGHIGSQIFGADGFVEAAERLLDLHALLLASGPVPELNLGGGFGVAYTQADQPQPFAEVIRQVLGAVATHCEKLGIAVPHIAIEPGRAVVATSTFTLYRVGTVKPVLVEVPGESGVTATRNYISVDGGMSDNARPALYDADYSARLANRKGSGAPELARVVGKHCESGDIVVAADFLPADVAADDLLAVPVTGAYCWSLSSNYNYVPRPAVVAVKDGQARIIIRGETTEDLLAHDAGIGSEN